MNKKEYDEKKEEKRLEDKYKNVKFVSKKQETKRVIVIK